MGPTGRVPLRSLFRDGERLEGSRPGSDSGASDLPAQSAGNLEEHAALHCWPGSAACWRFGRLPGPTPGRSASKSPLACIPRTNELVEVPYEKLGGKRGPWVVTDPQGAELPWQATDRGLLFPATLIPGELPEYRVAASGQRQHQLRQPGPPAHSWA